MNRMKRVAGWLAAALLLFAPAYGSKAEVTAEKQESRGRVTEIAWKDENGGLTAGPEGYAVVRYSYEYQKVTETYFDAEGFPYETAGGYYGRTITRDTKNKISMIDYLGINGKLKKTRMGYARVSYRYFTFGPEQMVIFHGEDGRPAVIPELGYSQVETQYSGKTLTGRIYMDERGNKIDIPAGYAMMQKKMNRSRQIIRVWYEHADGAPAAGPDGWSRSEISRDQDGRCTQIEYYDTKDNLTDAGGCAREEYVYDRDGTVTVSRFDRQGNRLSLGGDAVSVRRKMKNETVTEETFLNANGEPVLLPEGYAAVSYSYNAAGQLELIQYRNTAGDKTSCVQGYSAVQEVRDAEGKLLSRSFLDESGSPVNNNVSGVSEERFQYDETGMLTGSTLFDAAGNQMIPGEN